MDVKQVYQLVNTVTKEVLGDSVIVSEDLSNTVDVGAAVFNANSFDNYCRALIDHVGRVVFVDRVYKGYAPNVVKDGWEWGAALQKIATVLPAAVENEDWNLQNGTSYDPNVFKGAPVVQKFYQKRVTFEIDRSITEDQLKSAFSSATQLNGFVSMLFNEIQKSMTIKTDALIMRGINSMIADTIKADYADAALNTKSGIKAVNLLYLYKQFNSGSTLTAADCIYDTDFLKFASMTMKMYADRLAGISELFNIGGQARFTPKDMLHFVALSEFNSAAEMYLQADTYHDTLVALPNHEVVPFWQGSGTGYALSDTSSINVTSGSGNAIVASGILAVMFDKDALGVSNIQDKVTTQYNAKASFTNYFYKRTEGLYTDGNENFVVFFVA